ncbi:MAG: glycosylase [Maribacter sp.]|uniref:glycosylase n=1 Tax=Maribacter sp. TaxID=1897614 RepID=UPI003299447A
MKCLLLFSAAVLLIYLSSCTDNTTSVKKVVSHESMQVVFEEIKTPFKYGVVFQHPDTTKLIDSPTIFQENNTWYMTYIVFDGQGYETWLAKSKDLLRWESDGKILSFTEDSWDANQKAGYVSLVNYDWGGNYGVEKHQDRYWMTYLGGNSTGYEAGKLKIGLAYSSELTAVQSWNTKKAPILSPDEKTARWFENKTIYKSLIIKDTLAHTGHHYIMYYNAKGDGDFESIGMAVSDDMISWKRYGEDPVITREKGICGDAQIAKYDDVYIMFYFGAFWKPGAFERFACSYDLIHWTDWEGADLIAPSEDYDAKYAHKPWVIKWNDVVYHFYTAVGDQGRVIALATSTDLKNR